MPNIQLTTRLPILALALAACTTSSPSGGNNAPRQSASHAFSAMNTRLEAAASAISPHAAPVTADINVSEPCSQSGSLDLVGSFDSSSGSRFDLDATFASCKEPDGEFDGTLHWHESVAGVAITDAWNGTIDWTDSTGVYSCVFDYSSTIDAAGVHYAGTICGYDVNADLSLGN